jgi:hypothetical protein
VPAARAGRPRGRRAGARRRGACPAAPGARRARRRRDAHLRDAARGRRQRRVQGVLGLRPLAGRHQQAGVHGAAGAEQRSGRVRASEVLDQLAPLGSALPLTGGRAAVDEVAVGLPERVDVAHAAGGRCCHRLLEQAQTLLAPPDQDHRAPEQAEREHLEVTVEVLRASASARRACATCSAAVPAWRACSTATHPRPTQDTAAPSRQRSARASQPREADARPPSRCWWDTHTATRAASSQRPPATRPSKARSRSAIPSAICRGTTAQTEAVPSLRDVGRSPGRT